MIIIQLTWGLFDEFAPKITLRGITRSGNKIISRLDNVLSSSRFANLLAEFMVFISDDSPVFAAFNNPSKPR
uniref:Uncharacterized protein n=1 Tax=Lepeophtheirus salmonis TaxID=72036 RepID=A0A0K2U9C6_LEPSM